MSLPNGTKKITWFFLFAGKKKKVNLPDNTLQGLGKFGKCDNQERT